MASWLQWWITTAKGEIHQLRREGMTTAQKSNAAGLAR
jgi:hypothetical protein